MKRRKSFRKRAWTDAEIRLLCEWFPKVGAKDCVPILPGRSVYQISAKAGELNLKRYEGYPWPEDKMARPWRDWRYPVSRANLTARIAA